MHLLTLNRPDKLNAADLELQRQLVDRWRELEDDDGVRAVVLTGAGRAFCAGGDVSLLGAVARRRSRGARRAVPAAPRADAHHARPPRADRRRGARAGRRVRSRAGGALRPRGHRSRRVPLRPARPATGCPRRPVASWCGRTSRRVRSPRRSCCRADGSTPRRRSGSGWSTAWLPRATSSPSRSALADELAALPRSGVAATKRAFNQSLIDGGRAAGVVRHVVKVVDLSADVAGGFASKLFALAGLDVVRPAATDPSPLGRYLHAHKRLVAPPESDDDARALVADADVVFTSFDRGRYDGAGARPALRPSPGACVEVTTSTFGATGPYSGWRGGPLADWAAGRLPGHHRVAGPGTPHRSRAPLRLRRRLHRGDRGRGRVARASAHGARAPRRPQRHGVDAQRPPVDVLPPGGGDRPGAHRAVHRGVPTRRAAVPRGLRVARRRHRRRVRPPAHRDRPRRPGRRRTVPGCRVAVGASRRARHRARRVPRRARRRRGRRPARRVRRRGGQGRARPATCW